MECCLVEILVLADIFYREIVGIWILSYRKDIVGVTQVGGAKEIHRANTDVIREVA